MFKSNATYFQEIRDFLDTVPVINTHEHYAGETKPVDDVFEFLFHTYYKTDLMSAAFGSEHEVRSAIYDKSLSFDERYDLIEKFLLRSNKTSYFKALMAGIDVCWGFEEFNRENLRELQGKLKQRDETFYETQMDKHGIKAKIVDIIQAERLIEIVEKRDTAYSRYCRFAFTLPAFHKINTHSQIYSVQAYVDHKITCLDDYLVGFENLLKKSVEFGVLCLKDQSAYRRALNYENVTRMDAEQVFNRIISQPRDIFSSEEVKPLDDWLFHHFMRLARKYDLPVQLHTGHLAGNYNDIRRTNAVNLIPLMELHSEVKFDLFHANWPYMDEYLFIAKNFPNAYVDLCWAQIIDPLYCIELMKRALVTLPHSKVMVYGGDAFSIEASIGYLMAARDNVACALAEMVDHRWVDVGEAKQIAADWFFNNPNEFFGLGFDPFLHE